MAGFGQLLQRAHGFFNTLQRRAGEAWFPILIGLIMLAVFSAIGLAAGQVQEVLADYIVRIDQPFTSFRWLRAFATVGAVFVLASALRFWTARLLGANIMSYAAIAGLDRLERMFLSIAFVLPLFGLGLSFTSAHLAYVRLKAHCPDSLEACLQSVDTTFLGLIMTPYLLFALLCFALPFVFMVIWWLPVSTTLRQRADKSGIVHWFWALILPATFVALVAIFYWMPPWALDIATRGGPIPIVALSLAAVTAAGSYLIRIGRLGAFPVFAFVAVAPWVIGALGMDDNHQIRRLPGAYTEHRPTLRDAVAVFATPAGPDAPPIVLVSTEGGGIRAAFFTASALGRMADQCPDMARRILAISGVSGGAVGAAAYRASVMAHPIEGSGCALDQNAAPGWRQSMLEKTFTGDLLTPALAKQIFPELVQRFLPATTPNGDQPFFPQADRQRGLEAGIAEAFRRAYDDEHLRKMDRAPTTPLGVNPLEQSVFARWNGDDGREAAPPLRAVLPHLLINMTRVDTGGAVIAGTLDLCGASTTSAAVSDFRDLWRPERVPQLTSFVGDPRCAAVTTPDFPLIALAATSARFPLISPAGSVTGVRKHDGPQSEQQVDDTKAREPDAAIYRFVDGGYFDNSGIETLMSVATLTERNLRDRELNANRQIVLLHIDSNPEMVVPPPPWRADFDVHELQAVLNAREERVRISGFSRAAFATRFSTLPDGRTRSLVCRVNSDISMQSSRVTELRLGWILSSTAAAELRAQIAGQLAALAGAPRPGGGTNFDLRMCARDDAASGGAALAQPAPARAAR